MSELKKQAGKNQEAYENFWLEFGLVVKEGLYEDADFREKILEKLYHNLLAEDYSIILAMVLTKEVREAQDVLLPFKY